jgi:cyclic beta-1,2-glucan synthetase
VEQTLRLDPAGVYPESDFRTRNRCRNKIELLADGSPISEFDAARSALLLAEQAAFHGGHDPRMAQVAWYLIERGDSLLEAKLGVRPSRRERVVRWIEQHANRLYFGLLAAMVVLLLGGTAAAAWTIGVRGFWLVIGLVLGVWPALEAAIELTNRVVTAWLPPRLLPRMAFKEGIPEHWPTLVVVPTLIGSIEEARRQVEMLEIRALGNTELPLRYVLLSDYPDAPTETVPGDEEVLEEACTRIRLLNERFRDAWGDRFFLLHRKRLWNPSEGAWMGWERKRGKLERLNTLLVDPSAEHPFTRIEGDFQALISSRSIRFVLTLDADTLLPPGSARDLVRTAAHPFNRPRFDAVRGTVADGYAIFQPRVSVLPAVAERSRFARLFAGAPGIDPYTTAVSNVYQDLFGRAIFMGKGLYDVAAFHRALDGAFPENRILSHDLIESNFARTAYCSDIELFDDYPTTYLASARRAHRWIRGDWQIAPWLGSVVSGRDGPRRNPLRFLAKWKILDNLRRSLQPVAMLLLLGLGWTVLPGSPWLWLTLALLGLIVSVSSKTVSAALHRTRGTGPGMHGRRVAQAFGRGLLDAGFYLLVLPHQAFLAVDAVVRTVWRMRVSHRRRLEWVTASATDRRLHNRIAPHLLGVGVCSIFGLAVLVALVIQPAPSGVAFIAALAWILAPVVTWRLSFARGRKHRPLKAEEIAMLRLISRRTWAFFDRFVQADHRWLPPDNVQFRPFRGEASRTSPTNIGLALISQLAGYDLGYLPRRLLLDRLGEMLGSVMLLDRLEGHLFNWYDTRTGEVLAPRYISTVDSGNLAACLVTLRRGLLDLVDAPPLSVSVIAGLRDTVAAAREVFSRLEPYRVMAEAESAHRGLVDALDAAVAPDAYDVEAWAVLFGSWIPLAEQLAQTGIPTTREEVPEDLIEEARYWLQRPLHQIRAWQENIHLTPDSTQGDTQRITELVAWCDSLLAEMDFASLYVEERKLFSIGFDADRLRRDDSTYDLLASEARMASYLAVAWNQVEPAHWFRLGRRLTSVAGGTALVSWNGTMFEYLMPLLFCKRYSDTLLDHTYGAVVREQRRYGRRKKRPWGISESAYSVLNLGMDYQYRGFGVPTLGLRRGLAEDYVVAPYATMLALQVDPSAAIENLTALRREGAYGPLGFYEAIDYTPSRLRSGERGHIISAYMAHHQGMSLLALVNVLCGGVMQNRFHADPQVRAAEPLLQERIPEIHPGLPIHAGDLELEPGETHGVEQVVVHVGLQHLLSTPHRIRLLSNGHFTTMITAAGTGSSQCDGVALTPRKADATSDAEGGFLYVRDVERGTLWSMGHQPVQRTPDRYDCWFHAGTVQIARVDDWIETFADLCVSPEDNIELRRYTFTNYGKETRRLEVTTYVEVVLDAWEAFESHPAFSRLFVQTEWLPEHHALLAKRRRRHPEDPPLWMVHVLASDDLDDLPAPIQYETSRARFVGRGRTLGRPAALDPGVSLGHTVGSVLDPVLSLRRTIVLEPGAKQTVSFGLGLARSRSEAGLLADRYDNPYAIDRAFELARVYGLVELQHLRVSGQEAARFHELAGALWYSQQPFRGSADRIRSNVLQQPALWKFGISGDLPLTVVIVRRKEQLRLVQLLLKAYSFWGVKGLDTDMLILFDHPPSYQEEVRDAIVQAADGARARVHGPRRGSIAVHRTADLSEEERALVEGVAHLVVADRLHMPGKEKASREASDSPPAFKPWDPIDRGDPGAAFPFEEAEGLRMDNGFGGFSAAGSSYFIRIARGAKGLERPPMPWSNVIANRRLGFLITDAGAGYTWSDNSRENRLTPWSNDPIEDPHGEALYLRDREAGRYWSPTPGPSPGPGPYLVEHGFGTTRFRHRSVGLDQEVLYFCALDDRIKVIELEVRNLEGRERSLDATFYVEWVLGVTRRRSARMVTTWFDEESGALCARNNYNNEFAGRVAFVACVAEGASSWTADRAGFLGRYRHPGRPLALETDGPLDGVTGAGLDPCAAFRVLLNPLAGDVGRVAFLLGEADDLAGVRRLVERYGDEGARRSALEAWRGYWRETLGAVRFATPSEALNLLGNGWLLYQTLASRLHGRTGFYQSGGAFGFRDQLQDVAALVYSRPGLVREQLLLHAGHQFPEGDVLHWWHPPTGRGVRTRITDDRLWLPYITAFYVETTGDEAVLNEQVPYLEGPGLEEGEEDRYFAPTRSAETGSLYNHCLQAILETMRVGPRGLPLMGGGDWNDGLNRVGIQGRGESVWLAFFLIDVMRQFGPICVRRGDRKHAELLETTAEAIRASIETHAWDGGWYRRAYDDKGEPLGSVLNQEGRIFLLPQAWAVLSGAASADRAGEGLASAMRHLVSRADGLIRLLAPPFDQGPQNPGYIKGYVPGVRENGGQYTHGALWFVRALAEAGLGADAVDLLEAIAPPGHARSPGEVAHYQVEPYVVAADVYGVDPHVGRGGWTWYTGSAAWFYRTLLESILGIKVIGGKELVVRPSIPDTWPGYEVTLRLPATSVEIRIFVSNAGGREGGVESALLNGSPVPITEESVRVRIPVEAGRHVLQVHMPR